MNYKLRRKPCGPHQETGSGKWFAQGHVGLSRPNARPHNSFFSFAILTFCRPQSPPTHLCSALLCTLTEFTIPRCHPHATEEWDFRTEEPAGWSKWTSLTGEETKAQESSEKSSDSQGHTVLLILGHQLTCRNPIFSIRVRTGSPSRMSVRPSKVPIKGMKNQVHRVGEDISNMNIWQSAHILNM